jgi:hypothetical protein
MDCINEPPLAVFEVKTAINETPTAILEVKFSVNLRNG